jgi:hypothetical protein
VALESVPAGPRPVMVAAPVPVALPPQQQAQAALQTFAAVVRAEATEQPAPPPVVPATVESLTVTGILRKVELMFEQPPAVVLACAESFCAANPGLGAKDFLVWFKGEHDGGRLTGTGKWSASDSFQEKSS